MFVSPSTITTLKLSLTSFRGASFTCFEENIATIYFFVQTIFYEKY